jgi:hypothetical protein
MFHSQFGRRTCATDSSSLKSQKVLTRTAFVTHRQWKLILSIYVPTDIECRCVTTMGDFPPSDSR